MDRKIKHIIALALAVLTVFAVFGTVAVSATDNNLKSADFAVYFENQKNWNQVWAYTWMEKDIKDPVTNEVIGTEVSEVVPFPGVELSEVGTTTFIDKVEYPDATEHGIFEYKCEEYKQVMEDKTYDRAFVIFNQGFEHGQQSSAIHIGKFFSDIHLVGLDKDNNATIAHFVSPEYIFLFDNKKSL